MESKTPATAKADPAPITVATTGIPESIAAGVAVPRDTEWKITIQNSDGTKSEVMLSPISPDSPTRQEIRIVAPGAKVKEEAEDPEAGKDGKTEQAGNLWTTARGY
jgi:hypothetical protein